jgi:S1-C subfamily serine protease
MTGEPLGGGAGLGRRLRHGTATALALVAAGVANAFVMVPLAGIAGPAAADVWPRPGPLGHHATIVNGPITGSGFAIAEGLALTNAHVVAGRNGGDRVNVIASTGPARQAEAVVIAISRRMDLALLRIPAGFLPVVSGTDAPLRRGRALRAAGVVAGPGGPGPRLEIEGQVASEIFSLPPYGPGMVVRLPGVRRGFSGGPVLDGDGRLVGMVAALRPAPGGAVSATGTPLTGVEAFVLSAGEIRAETARLLAAMR